MPRPIPDRERYARAFASLNRAARSLRRALKVLTTDGAELEWGGAVRDATEEAEPVADGLRRSAERHGHPPA